MGATEHPYFVCLECCNMLREIEEFLDMLQLSDLFWKRYIKQKFQNNKQTKYKSFIGSKGRNTTEPIRSEIHPQEAREDFVQNADIHKLDNDAVVVKTVITLDDVLVTKNSRHNFKCKNEIERPYQTHMNQNKIEIHCDICDKGNNFNDLTYSR